MPPVSRYTAGRLEGITELLIILIVLLVVFGGGGFYVGRPGYAGAGADLGTILYAIAALVLIVLVLRLVGIVGGGRVAEQGTNAPAGGRRGADLTPARRSALAPSHSPPTFRWHSRSSGSLRARPPR